MSNHSGSYMLNDVLKLLDQYSVFDSLGQERSSELVQEIIRIGLNDECNTGEILEGLTEQFGLCSSCYEPSKDRIDGMCQACNNIERS